LRIENYPKTATPEQPPGVVFFTKGKTNAFFPLVAQNDKVLS